MAPLASLLLLTPPHAAQSQLVGWSAIAQLRGRSDGTGTTFKKVYWSPDGKRFRSNLEVLQHLGLSLPAVQFRADRHQPTVPAGRSNSPIEVDSSKDFWVACDRCHKWRNLYLRGSSRQVGDKWYCEQNPDPLYDDCSYAQEEEEEDEEEQADVASLNGFKRASDHAAGGSSSKFPPGAVAAPQQQVISSSSTSNAAGKRPRESDLEPPPGCMPPPVGASNYAEDHCVRSADGSTWKVEAKRSIGYWSWRWVYVPVESTVQRPVLEARLPTERTPSERTPCRHCSKLCSVSGRGLMQHEAICAARPGADGSAPTSNTATSTGAPIPPAPTSTTATASAAAPRASSAEHAQLVQRLEEHMTTHSLSQQKVAKAMKFSTSGKLSMWLGHCREQTLGAATMVETDAQIAAYLDRAPIAPAPTSTAATASAAAPRASSTEHAQLVQRLEEHMTTHSLSQAQVAKAVNLGSQGKLSMWLGHCRDHTLGAASMVETDARIAAYLDGAPIPPDHAQLVEQLEEHMAAHDLSQSQVAKVLKLASNATVSRWLGCASERLPAAIEVETDARITAYLNGWEMPQAQAAPPLKRPLEATLPAAAPKQRTQRNQWTRPKRWKQRTPTLTAVRGSDRYTVDQSGGCSREEEEGEDYAEYTAELLPIAADWPTARFPPATPPVCDCGTSCVWLRRRWFCARDESGCHFESEALPEPAPLTPLCHCTRPCKWLLGRWWCAGHPHGGCGFEHTPTSPAEPALVAAARGGGSRAAGSIDAEIEMARGCAAMLTASAFGLEDWCFVAPSDCGLGLFARSALAKGQQICEYVGPRLPLQAIVHGECARHTRRRRRPHHLRHLRYRRAPRRRPFPLSPPTSHLTSALLPRLQNPNPNPNPNPQPDALEIPKTGLFIDGARTNCPNPYPNPTLA